MDNTFFDFVYAKISACQAVIDSLGIDAKAESDLLHYFLRGKGIENLENIADYLRDRKLYTEELYNHCTSLYERTKINNIHLYNGVRVTLEKLKAMGLRLAVVTDADRDNAMLRLEKTNLKDFFDLIVTIETTGKKKPDPASISHALEELNVAPAQAMLVGDSRVRDIEPAKKLGMVTAYAAYGDKNYFETPTCEADFMLNDITDLIEIVKKA